MSPLAASGPNAEQIRYWNEQSGPRWVAAEATLDAQIAPLGLAAMERAQIAAGERVLDVGCGCGQTALAARGAGGRARQRHRHRHLRADARARAGARERARARARPLRQRRRPDRDDRRGELRPGVQPLRRDVLRRSGRGLREPAREPRSRRARRVRVLAGAGAQSLDARAAAGRGTPPAAADAARARGARPVRVRRSCAPARDPRASGASATSRSTPSNPCSTSAGRAARSTRPSSS